MENKPQFLKTQRINMKSEIIDFKPSSEVKDLINIFEKKKSLDIPKQKA